MNYMALPLIMQWLSVWAWNSLMKIIPPTN